MNRRLFSLTHGLRLPLTLTILSGLFAGWLTIGQARGLSLIISDVFIDGRSWSDVRQMMIILVGVIGLRAGMAWLTEVSSSAVAVGVKKDLRERLLAKIQALGPSFTRGERTGELTTTALDGVEALDAYFSQYFPQLILTALVPLSILIFVLPIDPLSGVVLLLTAPLIPIFMLLIGKGAEIVTNRQYEILGRLSAHFLDSLQGLVTLKQFGRSRSHTRTIAEASDKFRDITLSVLRVTFLSALALELIATISTAVVAVEVGLRLLYGQLPYDKALFLLILAPEFYIPLRMLGLRFHAGMAGTSAAKRIYEILDMNEEALKPVHNNDFNNRPFHTLSLSHLSFSYPGESTRVLNDINLELHAGEHLALVGPSGSGKSTLAELLLRYFQPETGDILVDDLPLTEIPLDSWREMIAWVPQDPFLFHDTIAANLRIARPGASQEELEAAIRAAHLDETIASLPLGYATIIGAGGTLLSGGQAQRLALARAFLKNAPFLILDEPTSNLDPQIESLLEESTRQLMNGRTVITIAHRLNTIANADRIVFLQEGRIAESGTHQELLSAGGVYAGMVRGYAVSAKEPDTTTSMLIKGGREERNHLPSAGPPTSDRIRRGSILIRLLAFLQGSWGWVALSVLLGTLTITASIGLMGTAAWIVATAALHPSIAELSIAIVGVRFFGITRGFSRYGERLTSHAVTFRLLSRLRTWFYEKLEPLSPRRLTEYRIGDLLNRILADVDTLENFYVRVVSPTMVALLVSVGTALFLGWYGGSLGWTYLGFSILLGLVLPFVTHILSRKPGGRLTSLRSVLRVGAVDYIQGLAELLAFSRSKDFLENIRTDVEEYGKAQKQMAEVSGLSNAIGVLITSLGMWTVLALSIPMVSANQLDGVMLGVLALMTLASFEALQPLPSAAQMLSSSLPAARRLFEVVDTPDDNIERREPRIVNQGFISTPLLQISGLTFTYPGFEIPALKDVSFDLTPGKKIALVGPSGAGKSTLINLLLRFWNAPPGSILLDRRDLLDFSDEAARQAFSVISQRTYLFNASIRENLLLADPEANRAAIEQAARQAGMHDFIINLREGYETMVGERGQRFSGGERQRLAIARALLRNAPIFLLDEPISHLDVLNGRVIFENILRLTRDRSLLLVTHCLIGMEHMDEILVLDKGSIIERGGHETLMQNGGLYRQMVDLQSRILGESL